MCCFWSYRHVGSQPCLLGGHGLGGDASGLEVGSGQKGEHHVRQARRLVSLVLECADVAEVERQEPPHGQADLCEGFQVCSWPGL